MLSRLVTKLPSVAAPISGDADSAWLVDLAALLRSSRSPFLVALKLCLMPLRIWLGNLSTRSTTSSKPWCSEGLARLLRLRRDGLSGLLLLLLPKLPLLPLACSKLLLPLLLLCRGALLVLKMLLLPDCLLLCRVCDVVAPASCCCCCCGRSIAGQLAALARGLLLPLPFPASGAASCGEEMRSGCRLLRLLLSDE
jgi:hypothetical protein